MSQTTFETPDGKTFTDRNEWRKYMFNTFYTFKDRSNETLVKNPGDIDGQVPDDTKHSPDLVRQPFNLENLTDCEVRLLDHRLVHRHNLPPH